MYFLNYTLDDRKMIRELYKFAMPELEKGVRLDVYEMLPFDFCQYMSPIEKLVWGEIRANGANLYPQVPCGPYFIDFADPYKRIAVEVDGKAWHKDYEKDLKRQKYIESHGYDHFLRWRGREVYADFEDHDYGDSAASFFHWFNILTRYNDVI